MAKQWQARCVICDKGFLTASNRPVKFCSNACKSKDYRARHPLSDEQRAAAVQRTLAWEKANPERKAEQRARYAKKHQDRLAEKRNRPEEIENRKRRSRAYYLTRSAALIQKATEWKKKNPERLKELNRRYREKHASLIREKERAPERVAKSRERAKAYYRKNADYYKAAARDRRAATSGAAGRVEAAFVRELNQRQRGRCAICRGDLAALGTHLDHIVPLALGGEHAKANLQLLCPRCNLSKSAKHPIDFMQERGFLC